MLLLLRVWQHFLHRLINNQLLAIRINTNWKELGVICTNFLSFLHKKVCIVMKTVQANLLIASEMSFHSSFFNQGCSSFQSNWILYPLSSTTLRFAVSAFLCLLLSGKLKRGGSVKTVGIGLDCSLNRSCHPSKYHRTSASGTMKSLPVSKFLRLQQFNQLMAELHFVVKFTKFLSPTFATVKVKGRVNNNDKPRSLFSSSISMYA